jgi:orotidine-5'-phosphate decarboxylase
MTPKQAIDVGVDYMVIGRPITQAANPIAALHAVLAEIQ